MPNCKPRGSAGILPTAVLFGDKFVPDFMEKEGRAHVIHTGMDNTKNTTTVRNQ